jgi:ABC-type bacteriocin/lantibiotic exporter with double-glycine peptidase domain
LFFLNLELPVIVNYNNLKSNQGHYAIIIGYNNKKKEFCLADPNNGYDFKIKEKDFLKNWFVKGEKTKKWLLVLSNKKNLKTCE